jgi:hypothetical protein
MQADAEALEGGSDDRARNQPTPVRSLGVLHAARGESDDRPVRWSHAHRPGSAERPPDQHPVPPFEYQGVRYLVSGGGATDWVRNLRAAGQGELRRGRGRETFRAVEVLGEEHDRVVAAYRERMGWRSRTFFAALPDPADHPVLRIEPMGLPSRG